MTLQLCRLPPRLPPAVSSSSCLFTQCQPVCASCSLCVCVCVLAPQSCPTLCDPWAHQTPSSMELSRKEYWSGLSFPSPGDLPNPRIESRSPALQADSLPSELPWKLCCTVLLYFSRYCNVELKMFSLFFCVCFLCILCVKSIINLITVQYYIANCISWVPRLTLLDLWTSWTNMFLEGNLFIFRGGTVCVYVYISAKSYKKHTQTNKQMNFLVNPI